MIFITTSSDNPQRSRPRPECQQPAAQRTEQTITGNELKEIKTAHEQPFITSLPYAVAQIGNAEQGAEFHALTKSIAGETADMRTEVEVFRHYYARLKAANYSTARAETTEKVLMERRPLAEAMKA
jgi:hypothetical protein